MSTDQPSQTRTIAGAWRRFGAFFLDCIVLGTLGLVVGFVFNDQLVDMGPWGRLVGFLMALAYFGTLNSKLAGGQTPGKRLLGIRVVAKDGGPLSVSRSFLRYLPLGAPWFLNDAQLGGFELFSFSQYFFSLAIFGIGFSVVYLFLFNRRTRQSVHDLLVGSYVVSADASGPVAAAGTWQGHLAVCAMLVLASAVLPYFAKGLAAGEPFAALLNVYRAVNAEPWVISSRVAKGQKFTSKSETDQSSSNYFAITAYSKDRDIENVERARTLAKLALSIDRSAADVDVIVVTLVYGYDIGIASSWRSYRHAFPPSEWLAQ